MSRFFSSRFAALTPYTPGEQPRDKKYIKLNTNESPFDVPDSVIRAAEAASQDFRLYSDPTCLALSQALERAEGVPRDRVVWGNGSDELLNFAFMAYCDENTPAVFPDVTYGFYPVFAAVNRVPATIIPLKADFTVDLEGLAKAKGTVFLANPNAPTGMALSPEEIESLVRSDPARMVVVDEAYVDFGARTVAPLTETYENLLVVRTFSKSRSMAGARIGYAIGSPALIADLQTLRYSHNPYNLNRVSIAAGSAMLGEETLVRERCEKIALIRDETAVALRSLGFTLTPSRANFLFCKHPLLDGEALYLTLKERGILVRHFSAPRVKDYLRITVGASADMHTLVETLKEILEEQS